MLAGVLTAAAVVPTGFGAGAFFADDDVTTAVFTTAVFTTAVFAGAFLAAARFAGAFATDRPAVRPDAFALSAASPAPPWAAR